jgi:hypothetical protein
VTEWRDFSRISRSVEGVDVDEDVGGEVGEAVREAVDASRSIPLLSAGWKRSSQGTGTNTQFSGLGKTPTGELYERVVSVLDVF